MWNRSIGQRLITENETRIMRSIHCCIEYVKVLSLIEYTEIHDNVPCLTEVWLK